MRNEASTDTMLFNPHEISQSLTKRSPNRQAYSFYKATLFINDFFSSILAFSVCALIFAENIDLINNVDQAATIVIFALASIAFFQSYKLYNYHIIYDAKIHVKQMAMAWGWNTLILFSAILIYVYGHSATDIQFAVATVAVAALLLLLKKYIDEYSIHTLTAIGISLIIVGWLGLLRPESSTAIVQAPVFLISGVYLTAATISLSRYLIVHHLFSKVMKKSFRRQTVIVGSNEQAENIFQHIIRKNAPFWVTGVVGMASGLKEYLRVTKDNLGDVIDLPRIIAENHISEIIITDETIDKKTLIAILDYCASQRVNAWFPPNYLPVISVKLYIDNFCGLPMVRLATQKNHWVFSKLKHSFDALLTLPIFLLQLPLFLAIAAAVKMTSRGPVFYKATAIGKGGRLFSMYKFRSMATNCDPTVHKQYVTRLIKGDIKNDSDCSKVLKLTDDKRITGIGKIIRKFSLDELPQLINVLKGDMSLVGPRPCLPYEYEAYEEWHKKRTAVRPGISGLWQVTGRSEVSFEEMILLDLYYVYNRNFWLDFSILFETVFVVIGKKGAC